MAIKVGFIGCGSIAKAHIRGLAKIRGVRLLAFCDVLKERAKELAGEYGGRYYSDYREMLNKEELDAAYICLPPFAHTDQEVLTARKRVNLFVEKPVALKMERAKEAASAIRKAGVITSVGYQTRYRDIVDKLRLVLKDKKPGLFMGYWMGGMPGVQWWRRKAKSGGQVVEQTTHIFDMARFLFGEVKEVSAQASKGLMQGVEGYDIEDSSSITLRFQSGIIGTIFSACFLKCGGKIGIDIFLKDMAIEYNHGKSIKIEKPGRVEEMVTRTDGMLLEDRIFIEAIKRGDPSKIRSNYEDGMRTLALTLAANESIKKKKPVRL